MTTFEIFTRNNGKYYYRVMADTGHNILSSDGYIDKRECRKIIKQVKERIQNPENICIDETGYNSWKFFVADATGVPIGYSMDFHSKRQCEKWVELMKECLPNSNVTELNSV